MTLSLKLMVDDCASLGPITLQYRLDSFSLSDPGVAEDRASPVDAEPKVSSHSQVCERILRSER
jgi:hypothetical protein